MINVYYEYILFIIQIINNMIAKTLSGVLLDIEVDTISEFLEQARTILDIPRCDELRFVQGDQDHDNMIVVIPMGHQRELLKLAYRHYRSAIFINSDNALSCIHIFSDVFDYYRTHFNPPPVEIPNAREDDLKDAVFSKMYEFERLLMNLNPCSDESAPTDEEIMGCFHEMYEAYEAYTGM